jgi:hypothetical protein
MSRPPGFDDAWHWAVVSIVALVALTVLAGAALLVAGAGGRPDTVTRVVTTPGDAGVDGDGDGDADNDGDGGDGAAEEGGTDEVSGMVSMTGHWIADPDDPGLGEQVNTEMATGGLAGPDGVDSVEGFYRGAEGVVGDVADHL